MSEFTLKTKTDANGTKVKVGTLSRTARTVERSADTNWWEGEKEQYLVNLRPEGRGFKVLVDVDGKTWVAGRLFWYGVGRYGIASNDVAVKEDGTLKSVRSTFQPRGYEHAGTIALCAERVLHEFLENLEYTTRKVAAEQQA